MVDKPEIRHSLKYLDFGIGFYTTTSFEQAWRWAKVKMMRESKDVGYVSAYEFNYEAAKENLNLCEFNSADIEWLRFVTDNRRGTPLIETIDMHIGPVADDNVYQSIRLFEAGILNADETIKKLKTETLCDQWTFHTEKALSYCSYVSYKEVWSYDT